MRRRIAVAITLLVSGVVILLAIPPAYEGPLLLYFNAQHAIRLVDGIGLAIAIPPWLYLNWLVLRRWARR